MGKISWLGPYENIKDDQDKFAKACSIEATYNKNIVKKAGKPHMLALWQFIGNPRGTPMIIGEQHPPIIGYGNPDYMTWFQLILQDMWRIFEPKLNENLQIIPLSDAKQAGLFYIDSLSEQYPGDDAGNAPGFKMGNFDTRQIGGWRWFSLLLNGDSFDGNWTSEKKPRMEMEDRIREKTAPKYYASHMFTGGQWKADKKRHAIYSKPASASMIPRRFSVPTVIGSKGTDKINQRYHKFTKIILEKLGTQWTLAVWNTVSFDYQKKKDNITVSMVPQITINLGWIEPEPNGGKKWGKSFREYHVHFDSVYQVRVGLTEKFKIVIPTSIKKETSSIFDGKPGSVSNILMEPYSKLVSLAMHKLNYLIE